MKEELLRTTSKGLEGTYENCEDHAQCLIPMIDELVEVVRTRAQFMLWRQGNNVHILKSKNGNQYVLRGFTAGSPKEYVGISLALRIKRGDERLLMTARHDHHKSLFRMARFLIQTSLCESLDVSSQTGHCTSSPDED